MLDNQETSNHSSDPQPTRPKPKEVRWLKKSLTLILTSVFVVFLLFNLFIYLFLNPYLKKQICQSVLLQSDSLYRLEVGKLEVSFWQSTIDANEVYLYKDTKKWQEILSRGVDESQIDINLRVQRFQAKKIKWLKYLLYGELEIGLFSLDSPEIRFENYRTKDKSKVRKPISVQLQRFFRGITPEFSVGRCIIQNAKVHFKLNTPVGLIFHEGEEIFLDWRGIVLKTAPKISKNESLTWQQLQLNIKKYASLTPNRSYSIKAYQLNLSTHDSLLTFRNLRVLPNFDNYAIYQALDPRVRFFAKQIALTGLDFKRLLTRNEYDLTALRIFDARLESEYTEELKPTFIEQKKPLFFERIARLKTQLRKLPIFLRMDSLKVERLSFQFWQKNQLSDAQPAGFHEAEEVNFEFYQLALGKALDALKINKPLYSENVNFVMRNYVYQTPDGLYQTRIGNTRVSSADSLAYLTEIEFTPMVSEAVFSARTVYQQMQIKAKVAAIYANGLDVDKLVYQQQFVMGGISLIKPSFRAYLDKEKPRRAGQSYQNFEQVLQSIPLFVNVDTFSIKQADFEYREKNRWQESPEQAPEVGIALHKGHNISLKVLHIGLGKALNTAALAEIDTKSLQFSMQDYEYKNSSGSYKVQLGYLEVSSAQSFIKIDSLRLVPNGDAQTFIERQVYRIPWLDISIGKFEGRKIDFRKLLMYQEIDWGYLQLTRPRVKMYEDARLPKRSLKEYFQDIKANEPQPSMAHWENKVLKYLSENAQKFYDWLPHEQLIAPNYILTSPHKTIQQADKGDLRAVLQSLPYYIKVDTLEVKEGFLDYQNQQTSTQADGLEAHQAQAINFIIPQIKLGKATRDSTFSHFYSGNILLTLKDYYFIDAHKRFYVTLEKVSSSLSDSLLRMEGINYQPLINQNQAVQRTTRAYLKAIQANAIDLDRLVFEKEFVVNSLTVFQPSVWLYEDRNQDSPLTDKASLGLEDWLAQIPLYVRIDTFSIKEGRLEYKIKEKTHANTPQAIAQHNLAQIDFSVQKVELASQKTKNPIHPENRWLYSSDLNLKIQDYTYHDAAQNYQFSIAKIQGQETDSLLNFERISLKPLKSFETLEQQASYQATYYDVDIRQANAKITDLRQMLGFKTYPFKKVCIEGVQVLAFQDNALPYSPTAYQDNFQEWMNELPFALQIDSLEVKDMKMRLKQKFKAQQDPAETYYLTHTADQAYVYATEILLDSNANFQKGFLFSKSFTLGLKNYQTFTPSELYQLDVEELLLRSEDSTLLMNKIYLKPTVNDKAFSRLSVFQTDRFIVESAQIEIKNLYLNQLLNQNEFISDKIHFKNLDVNVFRDKRVERAPDFKPLMPQEIFQQIDFAFDIDTLSVENGKVTYGERVPKGRSTGEVFFSNINGKAFDIGNLPNKQDTMRLVATCQLMGAGILTGRLKMPLNTPHLYCTYYGSLGQMQAKFFNRIIETNEYVRIRKGLIEQVFYDVIIKDTVATGSIKAGYKKLKITVLKQDEPNKKRKFITFLANLIIKSKNNLQSQRARIGKIAYIRKEETSFISMLWRSLATGLVDTLK